MIVSVFIPDNIKYFIGNMELVKGSENNMVIFISNCKQL